MTTDRHACEEMLVANLEWLRRTAAALCRRHGLGGADDAEEFASWAIVRLLDNDCAVLRQFRGESSLRTYLTVVTAMLFREYRVRLWGRWRPSAAARRAGPLAVRLETLVHRDGHSLGEAALIVRTAGETTRSERELRALFDTLPPRTSLRPREVGYAETDLPASGGADDTVVAEEAEETQSVVRAALMAALDALPAEDHVVVHLHYWGGLGVADIARRLGVPQKPLYRKLERALRVLRAALERAGVAGESVRAVLERAAA